MVAQILYALSKKHTANRVANYVNELIAFGFKNVLACFFPAFIFCMLILSKLIEVPFIPRYDFLLMACVAMQAFMYFSKLESGMELLVITMFHLLGLSLEIYKVSMGSWAYPEFAYSKIAGVPLYSGFMYASVGSYVCQAWRWLDLRLEKWPGIVPAGVISVAIYMNFFTHHYIYDMRWVITVLLILVFWNTRFVFTTSNVQRKIPMVLSFLLIGFFIWVGENIATFFGAWKYASQHDGWKMVSLGKISSWFLLVVLSIVIVVQLKFSRSKIENFKTYLS
ncbi:DUF817 domain-containing protein [Chryseosolibacter indicus]|uniref:DUF817 domain-containing protein n=1 Tax=Chryseosolibacter indicus TaxID=2782351 RepID=A0ABS5VWV8_9BACT|nr:DUF817 domain-containing protein [Chryseosolibacter indicus]MBT1705816.1 DUF817 domain-containing protein [Chryseosolibacter indicus]